MSTDVISGKRGLIGGWNEHQRDGQVEFVRADIAASQLAEARAEIDRLEIALRMPGADRRLWYISDLLARTGHFNRRDICEAFNISVPQASADIKRWLTAHPHTAAYNKSSKRYEIDRAALTAGKE